jgi:hypothetical protein
MRLHYLLRTSTGLFALTAMLFGTLGLTFAASAESLPAEVLIERDVDTIPDEIETDVRQPLVADTLITFTNSKPNTQNVFCTAFGKNGTAIGRTRTKIPGDGLRYVRASDFSSGNPFVGSVKCRTWGRVVATAVFVGPGVTSLPVRQGGHDGSIRVPLVATY